MAVEAEGDALGGAGGGGAVAHLDVLVDFATLPGGQEGYLDFAGLSGVDGFGGVFGLGAAAAGRHGQYRHGLGGGVYKFVFVNDGGVVVGNVAEIVGCLLELKRVAAACRGQRHGNHGKAQYGYKFLHVMNNA